MPRTRRNKLVSLTKTPKRNTRSAKAGHIDAIQDAASAFPTCAIFMMANQRTVHLQEVRKLWKDNSRIFVGKNRVMAKALGVERENEVQAGLGAIGKRLAGPVGLLFTDSSPDEIQAWFEDYSRDDFARAGNVSTSDVILDAGPVMLALDPPEPLAHSLEPQLRALGMPTELKRGVPTLLERFVVCRKGEKLTADKAQILKHLLIKDAKFRLIPVAYWTKDSGSVEEFTLSAHDEELVRLTQRRAEEEKKAVRASKDDVMDEEDDDEEDDDEIDNDADGDARDRAMMMPVGV